MQMAKLIQQTAHFVWISSHMMNLRDKNTDWNGIFDNDDDCFDIGVGITKGVVGLTDVSRAAGLSPIFIELYDQDPGTDDISEYSAVIDAPLKVSSGELSVESIDTDNIFLKIPNGEYCVRVYYGNDDTSRYDYADGANHARFVIFPSTITELNIRKAKENLDDPNEEYQGQKTEDELITMLDSPILSYRCLAVVALLQLDKLETVKPKIQAEVLSVKRIYASALWFAGAGTLEEMKNLSTDADVDIRMRIVHCCEFLRNRVDEVKDILKKLSNDKDSDVSSNAAYALELYEY